MRIYDARLPPVFRMLVQGNSGSGKSSLLLDILENRNGILHADFDKVIYIRGVETPHEYRLRNRFGENLFVFNSIPKKEVLIPLCKTEENTILIIEDLDDEAFSSGLVAKFYTAFSHHYCTSCFISSQNIFRSGQEKQTLFRNSTHLVIFKSDLDQSLIRLLSRKVYPKNPRALVALFDDLTQEPFSYLSIWSDCPPELKFRTDITKECQRVFVES